ALVGACLLATSRAASVAPVLMLYLIAGAGNGLGSVCYETLLQERTPDSLRGRVLAACDAVFDAALLIGYVLTGVLDQHVGPRAMFAIAGAFFLGAAVLSRMLLGSGGEEVVVDVEPVSLDEPDAAAAVAAVAAGAAGAAVA